MIRFLLKINKKQALYLVLILIGAILPAIAGAHQAPYSVAYMDVTPNRVNVEIHIPLTELELAYGENLTSSPSTLLQRMEPQLKQYMLAHTHAYVKPQYPWLVKITDMEMGEEQQIASGPPFWELRVHLLLLPQNNEHTRHFMFKYDAVVHQVINHIIFVTIRSDWQTGRADQLNAESNPMTIRIASDNKIHPLEIDIDKGSWFTGFKNMVDLGMQHIKEGTDHLLFLIVLLLPALLRVNNRRWSDFAGIRTSITRIFNIVTAFTIGHSITLLLGALGVFTPPERPIEILIAVSILISAIHALYPLIPRKEYYISGCFGLIHGMAFAAVMTNMNLEGGALVLSVLGFNIGIEIMQLFIIIMIIPWLFLLSQTPVYKYFRITGAILACVASIAWIMERYTTKANYITTFIQNEYKAAFWLIIGLAIISVFSYIYYRNQPRFAKANSNPYPYYTGQILSHLGYMLHVINGYGEKTKKVETNN